jgi:multisubunit Na+/H+ antiporter MnhC subunit
MFAALIPFVTALVVHNGATTVTASASGLNLLALSAMGRPMWAYATTRGRLVGDRVDAELARGASTMGSAYVAPLVSMVMHAAIVVAFTGFTARGRWEAVTVWRRSLRR